MRGDGPRQPAEPGFTLIEVIAAMLIFALGVLMVLQLSQSLSQRMEYAAKTGILVTRADQQMDSLEAMDADSLSAGSLVTTVTIEGVSYLRTVAVVERSPLLYELTVSYAPVSPGDGPSYTVTSNAAASW